MDVTKLPGMIEPTEIKQLYHNASKIQEQSAIIEFGCFMGKSTLALALGSQKNKIPMLVLDGFRTASSSTFAQQVINACNFYSTVPDKLEEKNQTILDFKKAFEKVMRLVDKKHENISAMYYKEELLSLRLNNFMMKIPVKNIGLLHIDLAKNWKQLSHILSACSPFLVINSIIIFQDFYYHWSSSIILGIAMLEELGYLKFMSTAASSMCCILTKEIDCDVLETISNDLELKNPSSERWNNIFNKCCNSNNNLYHYSGMNDMKTRFFHRLELAEKLSAIQFYRDTNNYRKSKEIILRTIQIDSNLHNTHYFMDLADLIDNNFDIESQSWL